MSVVNENTIYVKLTSDKCCCVLNFNKLLNIHNNAITHYYIKDYSTDYDLQLQYRYKAPEIYVNGSTVKDLLNTKIAANTDDKHFNSDAILTINGYKLVFSPNNVICKFKVELHHIDNNVTDVYVEITLEVENNSIIFNKL